ncbi:MAG TPA: SH3 domain-containing protein [Spirochaetota bacterium]|nr:SH3 domain-containing protein [Spirochaetota bacterium]HOL57451.1 SH3 domain-containing protein [Spirochaetota bacterium]HPP03623.1 SH3 domain-containing protein [Spirochaetota bacterium]
MSRLKIIFYFLFIFFLSCKDRGEDSNISVLKNEPDIKIQNIKNNYGIGVVNVDRLRFRALNDLHSKTLRYLDKGTIVTILSKDNERVRIEDIEDYWYYIEFEGIKGWVFGYYLDIYTDIEDAKAGARRYLKDNPLTKMTQFENEEINNNLFFLSNFRLCQLVDNKIGKAKILKTQQGSAVTNYYFGKKSDIIYYTAKNVKSKSNFVNLYSYNMETENNELILKNIYLFYLNKDNFCIIVSPYKENDKEFFRIFLYDLENKSEIKEITKIEKKEDIEISEKDILSLTLIREAGSKINLEFDEKKNVIYFKPLEENQTYLISLANGEYFQLDIEKNLNIDIDSSRFLTIKASEDKEGKSLYSIILKDKITRIEKEIIISPLYPINFSISPRRTYIAVTMISTDQIIDGYFYSSLYLISLFNLSIIPIATDGTSYLPKWNFN